MDADGGITAAIYVGACLTQITDISVVPEPPTAWLVLGLLGAAALGGTRRRVAR